MEVSEVVIMYDQEQKNCFGFVSFKDEKSVVSATKHRCIELKGKKVEIKRAKLDDGGRYNNMNADSNPTPIHHQGAPLGEFFVFFFFYYLSVLIFPMRKQINLFCQREKNYVKL